MSMNELNTTAHDLMSVRAMIEELEAEAQALTDKLKAVMVEQGDGSPPGGRLESHLEERGQQPVRRQAVQGRPHRPLRPVQPPPAFFSAYEKGLYLNAATATRIEAHTNHRRLVRLLYQSPLEMLGGRVWANRDERPARVLGARDKRDKSDKRV